MFLPIQNKLLLAVLKVLLSVALWVILFVLFTNIISIFNTNFSLYAPSFAFILTSYLMMLFFERKANWSLGIRRLNAIKSFGYGLLIGVLVPIIAVGTLLLLNSVTLKINDFRFTEIVKLTVIFLFVAIGEEIYFRGYIFGLLNKHQSTTIAIIVNSVFFTLAHLINPNIFSKSFPYLFLEMINILLLAYLFSITRYFTNSIWMPIGIHFILNVLQSSVFGFTNGGKQVDSLSIVCGIKYNLLNGNGFGLESSLILTFVVFITIVWVNYHYHYKKNCTTNLY